MTTCDLAYYPPTEPTGEPTKNMIAPLDVFKVDEGGRSVWLREAASLQEALALIRARGEGNFYILSQTTGHRDYYDVTEKGDVVFRKRVT